MTGFLRDRTACFSGHRQIEKGHEKPLEAELLAEIERLIGEGFDVFISGMALGFDILAAECVIKLKEQYDIKLVAAVPHAGQSERWRDWDRRRYFAVLKQCDETVCVSAASSPECYKKRNRFMVDNSAALITYLIKDRTGTAHTVNYAGKNALKITNLYNKMP